MTTEVLFMKFGTWMTIKNYEYVSVFYRLSSSGFYIYEVNLWFNKNRSFKLYEEYEPEHAFRMGYLLSEELNIDLLDATERNNYRWVDKEKFKLTGKFNHKD